MNYSKLLKENGKTFIFAEGLYNEKAAQLSRLQSAYLDVRTMLIECGLPAEKAWINAVIDSGADGLASALRQSVTKEIKRLSVPFYMADTYQAAAREHIAPEAWKKADELRMSVTRETDGLPLQAGDISITENAVTIDTEAILGRIRTACLLEITPERMADAEKVLQIAADLRALELSGVNALELVKKYVDAGDSTPAPLDLYGDVATRRHLPGQVSVIMQMPMATFASMYQLKR